MAHPARYNDRVVESDESNATRTWGPVLLVVLLLPFAFAGLRACVPPLGHVPPEAPLPDVSGSAACAACHSAEHEAWARSTHAAAEQELDAVSLAPLEDGALDVVTAEGVQQVRTVRTIGVDPLWQYLVPAEDGRLQVTQAAWDPVRGEWFDVFADGREPGEWGHWTGGGMNWNAQCASCHDTGVDKGLTLGPQGRPGYATTVQEHGVGCEACHGEAEAHVTGAPPPEVPSDRWLDVCASCHARRAELTGAFEPGEAFLDHFRPALVDASDAFWSDGQVREEDFEYTAFIGSTMHLRGVTCTSCHDPHSGELVEPGDALCLGCHEPMGLEAHDPHEDSVGCVACHAPVTTYMQRDPRHDHGFLVPDPGIEGVPDVCTRCHEDRDVAWAANVADQWWPDRSPERRRRAGHTVRARRGDPAAIPGLIAQLANAEAEAWRASAATLLEGFVDREDVVRALVASLEDTSPLVRMAAVESLASRAHRPDVEGPLELRLEDERRAVRAAAGRSLGHRLAPSDPRAEPYRTYLEYNRDQPSALLDAAGWDLARARHASAVTKLEHAIALDSGSPVLYDRLATAHARLGEMEEAAEALESAIEAGADDADSWYRLGLAQHGAGDRVRAREALETAVARDSAHPRAAYNLAVLLAESGDVDGAISTLEQAARDVPDAIDVQRALRHYRNRR